jgi:arabinogalactan endo-1,4-beta-galactosidase
MAGAMVLAGARLPGKEHRKTTFRNGLCATTFAAGVFDRHVTYRAGSATAKTMSELQRLMMEYGGNEVFARLGTSRSPKPGMHLADMPAAQERARMAKSVGLPLNPEFLLCGHYGDLSGQPEPDFSGYPEIKLSGPWNTLGIEEMCTALRTYGAIVAREILETGVKVNVWDIGNEVEFGTGGVALPPLAPPRGWQYKAPDGVDPEIGKVTPFKFYAMKPADQIAWATEHLWKYVGRILGAVAEGIKQVEPHAVFATHVSSVNIVAPEVLVSFYEVLDSVGFRTQQIGFSYYPTSLDITADRLGQLKRLGELVKQRLGRQIYLAEYAYAAGPVTFGGSNWAHPVQGYPISPQGQADFLRDMTEWGVRSGVMAGVRPWAPDYVGSGWQGMALFEAPVEGVAVARPGLSAIQQALRKGVPT